MKIASLQRKIKSRNTTVNTIEKAYENVNKTNEEDIIATMELIEKLCSLNCEIEELAEDAENNEEIYDGCLQSEVNITKKIKTLKSFVDKEKGLIKNSDSKPESFKNKFVNLPTLTVEKLKGDYTKFNTFMDSFVAAIDSCEDLKDIEKFNYLHSCLEGEAFRTIQGIKLIDKNYPEALEVLRKRYGNKQRIISAHMNELLNMKKVERDSDLQGLRRLYEDIESHVRSSRSLDVDDDNHGSLLTPIIMERLPHQLKLTISRQVGDDTWDLTRLLCFIRDELKAR